MINYSNFNSDTFKVGYNLTVTARNIASSSIAAERKVHNLVTQTARNLIVDFLNTGTSGPGITYVGVGTSTAAVGSTDTALGTEVKRSATIRKTTGTGILTIYGFMGSSDANGSTLTEAGLFDASTQGNLYARALYTGIAKTSSISISYAWSLTISAST